MFKRLLLFLLREEFAAVETMAFNNLQVYKSEVQNVLVQSFVSIRKEFDEVKLDLATAKTTNLDAVTDIHAILVELASEVDLQAGMMEAVENKVDTLHDLNDSELDDLEERIKDLEDKQ